MKYNIGMISLGCEKNRVDAEMLLAKINNANYNIVSNINIADAVIINTCGFIEESKKESIDEIFSAVNVKKDKKSKLKAIIVTGCLAERYKNELIKEIPEVDGAVGIGSNGEILDVLDKIMHGQVIERFSPKENMPMDDQRLRTTPSHYAYLKVADGCDNRCSYCSIPIIRGGFRSRKIENVLSEAKVMAENGVKELLLMAQDTTRYGEDIYGKPALVSLLEQLCTVEGIEWIRLLYCYPDRITDDLLNLMNKEKKILKYIDLPLQHCNGRVLKDMNRRGNKETLSNLIKKIRKKVPEVVIRTTFICGFPGETEKEFNELLEFVRDIKFERMGSFTYSLEEDTKAYLMENQINEETKALRKDILMREQEKIMDEYGKSMCGKITQVITDGFSEESKMWEGRSYADSPDVDGRVYFTCQEKNKSLYGKMVYVKILEYDYCDLIGELVVQPEGI